MPSQLKQATVDIVRRSISSCKGCPGILINPATGLENAEHSIQGSNTLESETVIQELYEQCLTVRCDLCCQLSLSNILMSGVVNDKLTSYIQNIHPAGDGKQPGSSTDCLELTLSTCLVKTPRPAFEVRY